MKPPRRPVPWQRLLLAVLIGLAAALALGFLFGPFVVSSVLFPTYLLRKAPAPPALESGEVWHLETSAGKVEALFFPAKSRGPAVMFAHGNGELIDDHVALGRLYQRHGLSALLAEYRGYGRSSGKPSAEALIADFVAFHDRLRAHPSVDPSAIYFHGRSLGGAVVAAAAAERSPKGLILESTFTSVAQLARDSGVPGFLVGGVFDSAAILEKHPARALILHGKDDALVPFGHAQRLQAILPNAQLVDLECGHNDCPLAEEEILQFLRAE